MVERYRRHGRCGGCPSRYLHDRRAESNAFGMRCNRSEWRENVGAVGFSSADDIEAEVLGSLGEFDEAVDGLRAPVAQVQSEFHVASKDMRVRQS